MGKKEKKGKKGKKSPKGKKSKKSAAPRMTFGEAIVAYKINLIEKKLEDVMFEVKGWEEKNERARLRNITLSEERDALANHTLKKQQEMRDNPDTSSCSREEVTAALKVAWEYRNERKKDTDSFEEKLADKDTDISEVNKEIKQWEKYRDGQMKMEAMEIRLLEQELRDLEETYGDMIDFIEVDNKKATDLIEADMNALLEKQKDIASNKAMTLLDKYSRQEIHDNKWLITEVETHEQEAVQLQEEVTSIERLNLEVMGILFDCRADDLKICKNFYLTQMDDDLDLETDGILEMDLDMISGHGEVTSADLRKRADERERLRPKSTTLRAIEDRLYPLLIMKQDDLSSDSSEEDGEDTIHSPDIDELGHDVFLEDEQDILKPGPTQLKLLSISGHEVKIHSPCDGPTKSQSDDNNSEWPITQQMIQNLVSTKT